MLDFPCPKCGRPFSLPDDEAGRDIQCNKCGVLVSVPLASDLASLNADGTLKMADPVSATRAEPDRLENLRRSFGRSRVDDDGEEIDNRTLAEEIEIAPLPGPARMNPVYDPETGELVTPFTVARPRPVPAIPVASGRVGEVAALPLGYRRPRMAAAADEPRRVPPGRVWLELFRPLNVVVMSALFVTQLLFNASFIVVNAGIIFFFVAPLTLFILMAGHYGNVVDEVATADMDELPRPLRQMSWHDDIWGPFRDVFATLMFVSAPVIVAGKVWGFGHLFAGPAQLAVTVGGTIAALLVAPAVLLTLRTSGSVHNLRPDRVLGVIRASGRHYLPVALLGLIAIPAPLVGGFASLYTFVRWFGALLFGDWGVLGTFPATSAILCTGIYLGHLFCWRLGLLYRMFQPDFPWVLQEAVRTDRTGGLARATPAERKAWLEARQAGLRAARQQRIEERRNTTRAGGDAGTLSYSGEL